jgi:hypothetical protein
MNEESILKQSLLFTGKLVGVVAVWVALLSFVVVTIATRVMASVSGRSADAVEKTNTVEVDSRTRPRNEPLQNPAKPNG